MLGSIAPAGVTTHTCHAGHRFCRPSCLPLLQVPRFWLIGYDENRQPLTPEQVRDYFDWQAKQTAAAQQQQRRWRGLAAVAAASLLAPTPRLPSHLPSPHPFCRPLPMGWTPRNTFL